MQHITMKKWILLSAILMIGICPVALHAKQGVDAKKKDIQSIKNVTFTSQTGVKFDLSKYHGKVLVVNFFATWCPPCMKEAPDLVFLQKKYGDNLQIIAVSVDEDPQALARFVKQLDPPFPIAVFEEGLRQTFGDISGIPTSFIVDKKLNIVEKLVGYHHKDMLILKLKKYF